MKTSLSVMFWLVVLQTTAQTQNGNVREINSDKQPLPNVYIKFTDAVPTTSDDNGNFRLAFSGKKDGQLIFMEKIEKSGYEIVNKKELEVLTINDTEQLPTDVIMAKKGFLAAAKKEYYDVSDAALLTAFEREKTQLRQQLQQSKITQKQFLDQKQQLQEQYDIQKSALDAMADKFARINFDDVDDLYKEAFELFKSGKIEDCILKLENADLIGRTNKSLEKIQNHKEAINQIQEDLQKSIASILLLAQNYELNFQLNKAEEQYDQLLKIDSNNLEIIWEASKFYKTYHRYSKAIPLLKKLISLSDTLTIGSSYSLIMSYSDLGTIYKNIGYFDLAKNCYKEAAKHSIIFSNQFPEFMNMNHFLAIIYSYLGELYRDNGEFETALHYFTKDYKLVQQIYQNTPSIIKYDFAVSSLELGIIYLKLNDISKAQKYTKQANKLLQELNVESPNDSKILSSLSISFERLGSNSFILNKTDEAIKYYSKAINIQERIQREYALDYNRQVELANVYMGMGSIYSTIGLIDSSLFYCNKSTKLLDEVHNLFLENVNLGVELAGYYEDLSIIYKSIGRNDLSSKYFQKAYLIYQYYYKEYPNNKTLVEKISDSHFLLGQQCITIGLLDSALYHIQKYNKTQYKLIEFYPLKPDYKYDLSVSYQSLGTIYRHQGNDTLALKAFTKQYTICKKLVNEHPNNWNYKTGLAVAHQNIGVTYNNLNDIRTAFTHLRQFYEIQGKVYQADTTNSFNKNLFAIAHQHLGDFLLLANDIDNAIILYQGLFVLERELLEVYPDNVEYNNNLAVAYCKLALCFEQTDIELAKNHYIEAQKIWKNLLIISPNNMLFKQNLTALNDKIQKL